MARYDDAVSILKQGVEMYKSMELPDDFYLATCLVLLGKSLHFIDFDDVNDDCEIVLLNGLAIAIEVCKTRTSLKVVIHTDFEHFTPLFTHTHSLSH